MLDHIFNTKNPDNDYFTGRSSITKIFFQPATLESHRKSNLLSSDTELMCVGHKSFQATRDISDTALGKDQNRHGLLSQDVKHISLNIP